MKLPQPAKQTFRFTRWFLLGISFVLVLLNTALRRLPDIKADDTITIKVEEIFPKPDGTKDYNSVKGNTSSFNAFSFYLMGDTPVSCVG
jgi:hypothetical protein